MDNNEAEKLLQVAEQQNSLPVKRGVLDVLSSAITALDEGQAHRL